jgi:anti-sigma factor RsiW
MSCQQVSSLIDAFVDGELSDEESLGVEQHVAVCDACSERTHFTSALRRSVRHAAVAGAQPSEGFEARLAGALRAERERILAPETSAQPPVMRRRTALLPLLLTAAATFSVVTWLGGHFHADGPSPVVGTGPAPGVAALSVPVQMNAEQVLDQLVDYHAAPPEPQITEPGQIPGLEPQVGVPVRMPALKQYGASWEGGSVVAMKNQHAAFFRYRISNRPVTVYVYDARRVPLRGVLEPRVVHNQPIHVGERRGYSIAAREQRGVGYAVASDMNDDESAELVSTIY